MLKGSIPVYGGFLTLTKNEVEKIAKEEPVLLEYIREFMGAEEYLHGTPRYCFWLKNVNLAPLIKKSKELSNRLKLVSAMRSESTKKATQKFASYPHLFMEIRQPESQYILVPSHSSENREYIPIGWVSEKIIASNACFVLPNASLYHFGVLTSSVHMAWMRTVAGRLKSDYRYSNTIVYNNFIWPKVAEKNKAQIEKTAQMILDARAKRPTMSLAQLYDELTMPEELRKAHEENDRAVMRAYGFKPSMTEPEIVAELFKLYELRVEELEQEKEIKKAARKK